MHRIHNSFDLMIEIWSTWHVVSPCVDYKTTELCMYINHVRWRLGSKVSATYRSGHQSVSKMIPISPCIPTRESLGFPSVISQWVSAKTFHVDAYPFPWSPKETAATVWKERSKRNKITTICSDEYILLQKLSKSQSSRHKKKRRPRHG